MATYVMLSSLTPEGSKTLHAGPERLEEVNREIEGFGCKIVGHVHDVRSTGGSAGESSPRLR